MATIADEIAEILSRLSAEEQDRVLNYARALERAVRASRSRLPPGTPLTDLAPYFGTISREQADEMERAIEDGCARIELDEHPFDCARGSAI